MKERIKTKEKRKKRKRAHCAKEKKNEKSKERAIWRRYSIVSFKLRLFVFCFIIIFHACMCANENAVEKVGGKKF